MQMLIMQIEMQVTPRRRQPASETGSESKLRANWEFTQTEPVRAHRQRSPGVDTATIISASRSRRPRLDPGYATHLTLVEEDPPAVVHAFGVSINERFNQNPVKPHRDQLPSFPPSRRAGMMSNSILFQRVYGSSGFRDRDSPQKGDFFLSTDIKER